MPHKWSSPAKFWAHKRHQEQLIVGMYADATQSTISLAQCERGRCWVFSIYLRKWSENIVFRANGAYVCTVHTSDCPHIAKMVSLRWKYNRLVDKLIFSVFWRYRQSVIGIWQIVPEKLRCSSSNADLLHCCEIEFSALMNVWIILYFFSFYAIDFNRFIITAIVIAILSALICIRPTFEDISTYGFFSFKFHFVTSRH